MSSNSFPHTILFSWSPPEGRKVAAEMIDVASRLKAHTEDPAVNWEVSIIMKMHKPNNSNTRPGMLQSRSPAVSSEPVPPVYFFRFPDCDNICSLVSNKEHVYTTDQIVSGDESMEKILTDYSQLIRRSFWKIRGQSFLLGKYIISIGKMEQGNISNSIFLEVSYIGEELQSTEKIYESIYTVTKSLFPSIANNSDEVLSYLDHNISEEELLNSETNNNNTSSSEFSIADRCLQWMTCLKHIT